MASPDHAPRQRLRPSRASSRLARRAVAAVAASVLLVGARVRPAAADLGGLALRLYDDSGAPGGGAAAPPTPELAAWAGPATTMTLPALLAAAVKQAPALETATLDIAIAEARVGEATGVDDWVLGADLSGRRATSTLFGVTSKSTSFDVGVQIGRALPTGGSVSLRAETGLSDDENDFNPSREWVDSVTASLSQPLLRGRGSAIARAAIARAKLARDSAALTQRQVAISAIQAVVAAYWDLALAERQLAIRRAGLDLIRERHRLTEAGISGGKVAPSELLAVDQAVATQEEQILSAEVGVVNASIALRRAAGLPIAPGAIALASGADASAPARKVTLDAALDHAYQTSPELAALAIEAKDATIEVEVAENGLLPQLDAALTLGPTGRDARPSKALEHMAKLDELTISGTLTFQYELGHRAASGAARQARLAKDRIAVDATDVRAQIAQAVAQAVAVLELAARRVELAQTAIDLATKNIEVEKARFSLGKSTNFDVLQRQNELQQAELSKAQAEIDARKGEASLSALTGDLLEEYGVDLAARRR